MGDFLLLRETVFSTSVTFFWGNGSRAPFFNGEHEFIHSLSMYLFINSSLFVKHMLHLYRRPDKHRAEGIHLKEKDSVLVPEEHWSRLGGRYTNIPRVSCD